MTVDMRPLFGEGAQGFSSSDQARTLESAPTALDEVTYLSGVNANGTIAATSYWTWAGASANKFGATTAGTGAAITYAFDPASNFTTDEQNTFRDAFAMWASIANVTFSEDVNAASANVLLTRGDDGSAWCETTVSAASGSTLGGHTAQAIISIDTSVPGFDLTGSLSYLGGYGMATVIHEVGHLLGLGHGGGYNGAVDPSVEQYSPYDMRLWTIMSYIGWDEASPKYAGDYPAGVSDTNWGTFSYFNNNYAVENSQTLMTLDIDAAQRLYGAATTGPLSGGLTFGFNCTITGPLNRFYDFGANTKPVVTLYSSAANNVLDLSGFTEASTVNLTPGGLISAAGLVNNIVIHGSTRIETAIGGSGDDIMTGDGERNSLYGGAGADTLRGQAGADTLVGDDGDDHIEGGDGDDGLYAAAGADWIDGGDGDDYIDLFGDSDGEADVVFGGAGNDVISGAGINDSIYAGDGDDEIQGALVLGATIGAIIYGDAGNDRIYGGNAAEILVGGAGNDIIEGGYGADQIYGGDGVDFIFTTSEIGVACIADGGAGDDVLFGDGGDDTLIGGDGGDIIVGRGGADWLFGGAGADSIDAGRYAPPPPPPRQPFGQGSVEVPPPASGVKISGGAGNDILAGNIYADSIFGDEDDDVIMGFGGADWLFGGTGDDLIVAGAASCVIDGGDGNDRLWGESGDDVIVGGAGADLLVGGDNPLLDYLFAGAGDDTLYGGRGTDCLFGEAGNDFIWTDDAGVFSTDYVYAGLTTGIDTVADFTAGSGAARDVLVVSLDTGLTDFAALSGRMTQAGAYTIIDLGGGAAIYLYNVRVADLTQDNFLFL